VFAVLKERDGTPKIRGSLLQLPLPTELVATAAAMTCRNPVLQTWQISVTAKQQPALRCEYTLAAMLFSGPESLRYVLDGKCGAGAKGTRAESFTARTGW
jgi:hypothetical protein